MWVRSCADEGKRPDLWCLSSVRAQAYPRPAAKLKGAGRAHGPAPAPAVHKGRQVGKQARSMRSRPPQAPGKRERGFQKAPVYGEIRQALLPGSTFRTCPRRCTCLLTPVPERHVPERHVRHMFVQNFPTIYWKSIVFTHLKYYTERTKENKELMIL